MKVVILGAGGMLGTDLMQVFRQFEPIGFNRTELDICDRNRVDATLADLRPDFVINASGYTAVDAAETVDGRTEAMLVNGTAVGALAEVCHGLSVPLVHFSTDYVFDGGRRMGYKENDRPAPINMYGESKFKGEQLLQKATDRFYLIRTSWLYGHHGKNFVTTILDKARTGEELKVVNDQFGKPTWTLDLAESVMTLLLETRPFGIYHLVNEGVVNWHEYASEICEIADLSVSIAPVSSSEFPRAAKRPAYSALVNTNFPLLRHHSVALRNFIQTM